MVYFSSNTKQCCTCKQVKQLDKFSKNKSRKDGYCHQCKDCIKKYQDSKRDKIREYNKSYNKEYNLKNKTKVETKKKECTLRRKYNLTIEQANDIYSKGCEICGCKERLAIDHCHETGKIRGCLCFRCNVSLGIYENFKEKAEKYLNHYKELLV
jgi:hypothetical protein